MDPTFVQSPPRSDLGSINQPPPLDSDFVDPTAFLAVFRRNLTPESSRDMGLSGMAVDGVIVSEYRC